MAGKDIKRSPRERRKVKIRKRLAGSDERPRICVYRSGKHTYAQLISDQSRSVLLSASTLDKEVVAQIPESNSTKGVGAAMAVGKVLAERAISKNYKDVVFDRNGYLYHGRVKALATGAREAGLNF